MTTVRKQARRRSVRCGYKPYCGSEELQPNLSNHFSESKLNAILVSLNEFLFCDGIKISLDGLNQLIMKEVKDWNLGEFLDFVIEEVDTIAFILWEAYEEDYTEFVFSISEEL